LPSQATIEVGPLVPMSGSSLARSRLCQDLKGRGGGAVDYLVDVAAFFDSDNTHTVRLERRGGFFARAIGVSFAWLPKREAS
jgi:hypothetical protein